MLTLSKMTTVQRLHRRVAANTDEIASNAESIITNLQAISSISSSGLDTKVSKSGSTMTGVLKMGQDGQSNTFQKILNVAPAENANEVVVKSQLDANNVKSGNNYFQLDLLVGTTYTDADFEFTVFE